MEIMSLHLLICRTSRNAGLDPQNYICNKLREFAVVTGGARMLFSAAQIQEAGDCEAGGVLVIYKINENCILSGHFSCH